MKNIAKSLTIGKIHFKNVRFGNTTKIEWDKTLAINKRWIAGVVREDSRVKKVDVKIARPGESARVVCIKDVIPIKRKIVGKFGEGITYFASNVVVTTLGQIVAAQEGILDMSGPGAKYSPFSQMINICLDITPKAGLTKHQHEEALREAGLRVSDYLSVFLKDLKPDETEDYTYDPGIVKLELPTVGYIYTLLAQGLMHHTYIDGMDIKTEGLMPHFVENPLELLDGLIVSGNCVSACDKSTTWHHWNNGIVKELLRKNGKDWNFTGVILSSLLTNMEEKEKMACEAVLLMEQPTGVIITKEGFGNPDADVMLLTEHLEKIDIKTVSIHDEYCGEKGVSQPLADFSSHANAIVSVGNANETIILPKMKRTIGPHENLTILAGSHENSVHEDGTITVQLQAIYGATNQLGHLSLTCKEV